MFINVIEDWLNLYLVQCFYFDSFFFIRKYLLYIVCIWNLLFIFIKCEKLNLFVLFLFIVQEFDLSVLFVLGVFDVIMLDV